MFHPCTVGGPGPSVTDREHLVGVWRLRSYVTVDLRQEIRYPLGPEAQGQLMYSADGYMSGFMMRGGRKPFTTPRTEAVHRTGDDAEIRQAFDDCFGYAGTFTFDAETGEVQHHLEVCLVPGWTGRILTRFASAVDELDLTLTSSPRVVDGIEQRAHLSWTRGPHLVAGASTE